VLAHDSNGIGQRRSDAQGEQRTCDSRYEHGRAMGLRQQCGSSATYRSSFYSRRTPRPTSIINDDLADSGETDELGSEMKLQPSRAPASQDTAHQQRQRRRDGRRIGTVVCDIATTEPPSTSRAQTWC
jgi:hypothetical protein